MRILNFNDAYISEFVRQSINDIVVDHDGSILDLGCGELPYQRFYHGKFAQCVAADYDVRSSAVACRLSAESLPFREASFDCVLFSEVIEHIPQYDLAISEISRVLKPGGTLIITWPFMYPMHEIPADFRRFTEFGMQHDLKKNGLEVTKLSRRGGAFALSWQILEFFVIGSLEALCRIRLVGWLLKPGKFLVQYLIFSYPLKIIIQKQGPMRGSPQELKGVRGQLAGWTMGYCAIAKRQ